MERTFLLKLCILYYANSRREHILNVRFESKKSSIDDWNFLLRWLNGDDDILEEIDGFPTFIESPNGITTTRQTRQGHWVKTDFLYEYLRDECASFGLEFDENEIPSYIDDLTPKYLRKKNDFIKTTPLTKKLMKNVNHNLFGNRNENEKFDQILPGEKNVEEKLRNRFIDL
jgi:hypothetical protein